MKCEILELIYSKIKSKTKSDREMNANTMIILIVCNYIISTTGYT